MTETTSSRQEAVKPQRGKRKLLACFLIVVPMIFSIFQMLFEENSILFDLTAHNINSTVHSHDAISSPTTKSTKSDDSHKAYAFAMKRYNNHPPSSKKIIQSLDELPTKSTNGEVINLIRFPKCASSYISKTARSLAGCQPDGFPCCIKKFDICPRMGLWCPKVRGCVDHGVNYDGNLPTITMFRDPANRLLSGFFYEGVHRPADDCYNYTCFDRNYVSKLKFQNALSKMLLGYYPYREIVVNNTTHVIKAKQRLCKFAWFGMVDMPIASQLLLYEMPSFRMLLPNPVIFDLPPRGGYINDGQTDPNVTMEEGAGAYYRQNDGMTYVEFKSGVYVTKGGRELVKRYNAADFELYRFARLLFCARIRESGLLEEAEEWGLLGHFQGCFKDLGGGLGSNELCGNLTTGKS